MEEEHVLFAITSAVELSTRKTCLYDTDGRTSVRTELLIGGHVIAKLTTQFEHVVSEKFTTLDLQIECAGRADAMERELIERLAASLKAGINMIPSLTTRGT